MRKSIVENVRDHAMSTPNKTAVITPMDSITYSELYAYACGYAKMLISRGLKKANIVVLRASQTTDYAIQYLGIHLAGGVVTSLEKSTADMTFFEIASTVKADAVITDAVPDREAFAPVRIPQTGVVEMAKAHLDDPVVLDFPDLNDRADILFTTGTTGSSKGVVLTHKALVATAENLIYGCEYKADTMVIVPGPLNHANAIRKLFTTFVNGSTIYLLNGMTNIKAFYTALDCKEGRIACCLPPAAIRTIFTLTRDRIGKYAGIIDFIESATSPLPEADKKRLCELLPDTRLYNNYGSSEAASVCMYDYHKYLNKENCVGKAMPNSRIVVVDEEHNEIASSYENPGLIACIGDVNMQGYLNEPELTKEVLNNGIVYTSDLGYIGEDGFIYVIGRKGDVINVGGLKVSPTEVESAALEHEGIEDCICISVPDPITTNALKLLCVLRAGYQINNKEMSAFLADKLETYKIPRFYESVDHVERTYNGKLNRKAYLKTVS